MWHPPKKDLVPTIIAWGGFAFATGLLILVPIRAGTISPGLLTALTAPLAAWAILVIIPLVSTTYEITPTELIIRFGLRRICVPIRDIVQVASTDRMFRPGRNYLWSLDRLLIRYRRSNGKIGLPLAIAPEDKKAFLQDLQSIAPNITVVNG